MFRKTRIKFRVLGYLNTSLSTKQRSEINRIYKCVKNRVPGHVWRELTIDNIAALYVWEIVAAGIVSFDALSLRGVYAWRFANDQVQQFGQVGTVDE